MLRKVFYSFHYQPDCWRAATVRNIGLVEGNTPASDNDWESIRSRGDTAIKSWIDSQMQGRQCCVVLVGSATAGRKWIDYEIESAWNKGLGVVGVRIHSLKDASGLQSQLGASPFAHFTLGVSKTPLASVVQVHDSPYSDSKLTYNHISANISSWIEQAIVARARI
jgi:hypothetical protein